MMVETRRPQTTLAADGGARALAEGVMTVPRKFRASNNGTSRRGSAAREPSLNRNILEFHRGPRSGEASRRAAMPTRPDAPNPGFRLAGPYDISGVRLVIRDGNDKVATSFGVIPARQMNDNRRRER